MARLSITLAMALLWSIASAQMLRGRSGPGLYTINIGSIPAAQFCSEFRTDAISIAGAQCHHHEMQCTVTGNTAAAIVWMVPFKDSLGSGGSSCNTAIGPASGPRTDITAQTVAKLGQGASIVGGSAPPAPAPQSAKSGAPKASKKAWHHHKSGSAHHSHSHHGHHEHHSHASHSHGAKKHSAGAAIATPAPAAVSVAGAAAAAAPAAAPVAASVSPVAAAVAPVVTSSAILAPTPAVTSSVVAPPNSGASVSGVGSVVAFLAVVAGLVQVL